MFRRKPFLTLKIKLIKCIPSKKFRHPQWGFSLAECRRSPLDKRGHDTGEPHYTVLCCTTPAGGGKVGGSRNTFRILEEMVQSSDALNDWTSLRCKEQLWSGLRWVRDPEVESAFAAVWEITHNARPSAMMWVAPFGQRDPKRSSF